MNDTPPLPDGFTLDAAPQGGGIPPPPAGFQLDHPDEQPPGFLEQFGHQLGLTGRYALEGAGNLAGVVSDPLGQFLPGYQKTGELAASAADALGLPKPQGSLEKTVGAASKALVGTGLTAGLGSAAGAAELAAQPGLQAASAILGGAGEEKGGAVGGLVGSLLPGGAAGLTGLSKLALRGGSAGQQRMADNLAAFQAAGTTPTVGQATEGGLARGLESLLAKLPGGSGRMATKAQTQADEIGARANAVADNLSPGSDPTQAGLAIQQGITGQGGFIDRFKQQSKALYDAVDQHMPPDTSVGVPATVSALYKITKPIQGAENVSDVLSNPKLASIADAFNADVRNSIQGGGNAALPYQAIKDLRSKVGDMIADAGLVSDVPKGQLKQLYGALSEDMRNGLQQVSPEAYTANNIAENAYRQGLSQIDKVDSIVGKAGGPEKVFAAAMSGTREGASTLNNVMSALQPEEQKVVASAVVKRLGAANPGQQTDLGDVFSPQTFLTNWNKLAPQAKQTLFAADPDTRAALDQIAKASSNIREGSRFLANPSGTGQAVMHSGTATAAILSALSGNVPALVGIGGTVGAANIGARLMTNPDFVKWLARNTTAPVGVLGGQIGYLDQLGQSKKDQDLRDAAQLLSQNLGSAGQGSP